jgi:hypothetical protein
MRAPRPEQVRGRLILLPALSLPAARAAPRLSPLVWSRRFCSPGIHPAGRLRVSWTEEVKTMQAVLRLHTKILPGHRLEISSPELPEGESVEVLVLLPSAVGSPPCSALELIESLQGHRLFQSPDEVDRSIQEERDSWER